MLLESSTDGPLDRRVIARRPNGWLDGGDPYVRRVRGLVAPQLRWDTFVGRDRWAEARFVDVG